MNIDNLVTMANQIGSFYASFPDREEEEVARRAVTGSARA